MSQVAPRSPLQANDGGAGLATAASTQLFAAQSVATGGGATNIGGSRNLRIYLTDLVLSNSSATAAIVQILDGLTVVASFWVGASSPPYSIDFSTPVRGTANTAMNIKSSTASATIFYTATGYAAQ